MQTVKNTIAENFGQPVDQNKLVEEENRFSLEEVPDLSGKVAVLTGGTEGIGYGCSHTLLSHNISKLFILSPSEEIYEQFKENVSKDIGSDALQRVVWKQCDLSDFKQVVAVADAIVKATEHIDILINCAGRGIMTHQLSKDGIDLHMAINHFGHTVLTSHLLPLLKKTAEKGKVRIVNLASNAHQAAPKDTKFASLEELNTDLGANPQYGRTKLATLLHARYLASKLRSTHPNILVNASHPGFVETRQSAEHIQEPFPILGKVVKAAKPIKKDVFDGCVSTMYCATATENSGEYVCPPKIVEKGTDLANDMELAEQLMKLTRQVVDEKLGVKAQGCPLKDY